MTFSVKHVTWFDKSGQHMTVLARTHCGHKQEPWSIMTAVRASQLLSTRVDYGDQAYGPGGTRPHRAATGEPDYLRRRDPGLRLARNGGRGEKLRSELSHWRPRAP